MSAMIDLHPQFVTDANGKRIAVQLPVDEFERLIDEAEMAADIALYEAAKAEGGGAKPFDEFLSELPR